MQLDEEVIKSKALRWQQVLRSFIPLSIVVRMERLQAWHYLIAAFIVFGLAIGFFLFISDMAVFVVPTLAVLAVFGAVIVVLARIYQNGW